MNIARALEGLENWRPNPVAPPTPPQTTPPAAAPASSASHPPMYEDAALAAGLDGLVGAAVQAVAAGPSATPPMLPTPPSGCPALAALADDLHAACQEQNAVETITPELVAIRAEMERRQYPATFFENELLPLLKPARPGLCFKVLRVEPTKVVLVTPTGTENALYHPDHNPGLGGRPC